MLYIEESLLKDEKLVFASRPHWIVFAPSVIALVIALLAWIYTPQYFGSYPVWRGFSMAALFSGAIAIAAVIMFLKSLLFFTTSEYAVTDRRVVMKMGWLNRDAIEIFLQRIEAINVSQTLLGRILNYGTIIVIGTGGTSDYYPSVPNPLDFHRKVQRQMGELFDKMRNPEVYE